jgi:hypothetical protein
VKPYDSYNLYFGDLHTHCAISYGKGTLETALRNAKMHLDFCSVTGHAHWPDMPEPNPATQRVIDFHNEGFDKLKQLWPAVIETMNRENRDHQFVTFPGFEIHSMEDGDRTIIYRDGRGEIIYAKSIPDLEATLRDLAAEGTIAMSFPHHIGYKQGRRGINWKSFNPEFAPIVEIASMHGMAEDDEAAASFLHTMGPGDGESTMVEGLRQGHFFGAVGNTDHHSASPGSYGCGVTGVWAEELTRKGIWDALVDRRTYACTGDKIALEVTLDGFPMGSVIRDGESSGPGPGTRPDGGREIAVSVHGGGPIDYVDIVKNGRLLERFSQCDIDRAEAGDGVYPSDPLLSGAGRTDTIHTKLFLELGWGHRDRITEWDLDFGIDTGRVLSVEPRFRGPMVLSPLEKDKIDEDDLFYSWERADEKSVSFYAKTWGNPNPFTNSCQGICLEVEMPVNGRILLSHRNNPRADGGPVPLERALKGAVTGYSTPDIEAAAWRIHRAPRREEFLWDIRYAMPGTEGLDGGDFYYVRVRQKNGQMAWSSPIRI